ncbi:MAG: trypsin-like serine protease [Gemmatimonadetes bacterium]|nr:trypsin-like serine protease [Gemmatimonadota bacterium]
MRPRALVPAVLACLAGFACEANTTAPVAPQFITYGASDDTGVYANVGAFIVREPGTGRIFPICSGTLIAPTVFLTAAHCTLAFLQEFAPDGWDVFVSFSSPIPFGDLTSAQTPLVAVTNVVSNPAFNPAQSDPGDIGVLLLDPQGTAGIQPATLPAADLLEGLAARAGLKNAHFTAVGYGVQNFVPGGGVPIFQDVNPVPRMFAHSSFRALGPGYLRLSQNPATGDGGTCAGDSGGPNFLMMNGTQILVATTVTGDTVCRATNVVYRIDTASARAFLGLFVALP